MFKDVDSIPPGKDFRKEIRSALQRCQICLAVIGPRWVDAADSNGRQRLADPGDHLRIELEAVLTRGIQVIPVPVGGASLPSEERLPKSLATLPYLQQIVVRPDPDFHNDIDRLIAGIDGHLGRRDSVA